MNFLIGNKMSNQHTMPKLDLEKWDDFYKQIESKEDPLAKLFQEAYPNKKDLCEEQKELESKIEFFKKVMEQIKDNCGESNKSFDKMLDQFIYRFNENKKLIDGNPSLERIKNAVATILGVITENKKNDYDLELRSQYFDLLVNSNLLPLKGINLKQFSYDPGFAASEFLNLHPEIKIVSIGCGHETEKRMNICGGTVKPGFHSEAMNIDIAFGSDPDILTDMNDLRFWNAIPEDYLSEVHDHTNTKILCENPDTIKAIYKALAPNGKLFILNGSDENQKQILKKNGFIPENDKLFVKTSI